MIKNYLKLTFKLLKRKKIFSAITILGMTVPLMFLMIIISSISHFTTHDAPESKFDRVILLDKLKYSIERPNSMSGNMESNPTYHFVRNYIKPMKSPEKVGIVSGIQSYNCYINNKKARLKAVYTDADFWEIADFEFIEGKAFYASDVENSQLVAVIDEHTRKLVFGDENALGKTMRFFKRQYKIIGVVKNVDITRQHTHANVWLPITTSDKYMVKDIFGFGTGCTCILLADTKNRIPQIEEEFSHIIKNFQLGSYEGLTKIDGELSTVTYNKKLKGIMNNLFSVNINENYIIYLAYIVIFFFFIVLPSVNLLYVHSSRINERLSEIGVRKSFGGAQRSLSGQFITENITISFFSGLLGLICTFLFFWIINRSQVIPGLYLSISLKSLIICIVLWLIFGISTGLLPAIRMSRVRITDCLNRQEIHQSFTILARKIKRLKILLVLEFVLTFLSLAVILTFVFRFQKNNSYPLGFDYHDVYQVSVKLYDEKSFIWFGENVGNDEITDLIKSYNLVEYYGKWRWNEPYFKGYTTVNGGVKYKETMVKDNVYITITGQNMDKIFKLKVINGRWFDETDERPDYKPVILNLSLKERLFGDENAIGEYVNICDDRCQVIGIVDHYKYHGEFSTPVDIVFSKGFFNNMSIKSSMSDQTDFFRIKHGTAEEDIHSMARSISQKYPEYEINITSLDSVRAKYLRNTLGPIAVIASLFFLILLIVLLGLYGVLWYDISLRKHEIGIRRATGATSGRIFSLIVKEMLVWASLGMIIGIIFFVQIPFLNLFSVELRNSVISVLCAALIIYMLVIICSIMPASQAAKIQPAVALHEE
jgi:putative ABC transport system permease protein